MSLITTKNLFHGAIDGIGFILQGAPDRLAYQAQQAPIYGQRFASGDRSYTDFSFWWYWAQTDFSGGQKREARWEDDGKYYSAEGINTAEQPGSVILASQFLSSGSVAKTMVWTDYGEAGGIGVLVGRNTTDQKMRVTKVTASVGTAMWEDSATGATEKINCCDSFGGDTTLLLGSETVGSGASTLKSTTGGAAADIGTLTAPVYAIVPHLDGDAAYVFTYANGIYKYDRGAGTVTSVKAAYPLAQNATKFSFGNLSGKGCWLSGDRIYFTMTADGYTHLMAYDISDNAYVRIFSFGRGLTPTRLIERNGNIYCFGKNANTDHVEIWKYVISSGAIGMIHEIGRVGDRYQTIASPTKDASFIYFTLDDNTSDYEIWMLDNNDALTPSMSPVSAYASSLALLGVIMGGYLIAAKDGVSGTNRFDYVDPSPGADQRQESGNIKTSIFDGDIPAIDKLFHSITITFNQLLTSQSITVEYSTDEGATFTSIGSASYASDGGTIVSKKLYFGSSVVSKKLQFRFTLAGAGTNTPYLRDFSCQYVPITDYAKQWDININCATNLRGLDGGLVEKPGREVRAQLEKSWLTKALVDFQDLDYQATQINENPLSAANATITVDDTAGFPEQGRLRIENEEILYTGKTPTTFTGCTRGARGTTAASHADNTVVSNGYRVIITNISERIPIMNDGKWLEYTIGLSVREA